MAECRLKARAARKEARLILFKMLWENALKVMESLEIQDVPQTMSNATVSDCGFALGYGYGALE